MKGHLYVSPDDLTPWRTVDITASQDLVSVTTERLRGFEGIASHQLFFAKLREPNIFMLAAADVTFVNPIANLIKQGVRR